MRVIAGNRFDLHGFYIRIRRGAIRVQGRNRFVSHRFRNYLLEFLRQEAHHLSGTCEVLWICFLVGVME